MIAASVEMESRLPLLITGIAGVPGYNALSYFRARYPGQVIGIRRSKQWPLAGEGIVGCDIEDRASLGRLFAEHGFRSVLDCAGSCALRACEMNPELAWRVNVEGAEALLDVIGTSDVRMVRLSIDLVFAGREGGGYVETDRTDPVTVYGKTMVAAEEMIERRAPETCILRISLPMGVSFNGHAGAIDWIQSRFQKSKPATLYFDEVRTPSYTDCMNALYETMLAGRAVGIYHAGGPRRLSLYEIAQIVNRVGGYDPQHLMGCPRVEAGPMPPRAGNVTMDSSKLADLLGYEPLDAWPHDARQLPTDREWHWGRDGIEGSAELLESTLYRNPRRAAATRSRLGGRR